MSILKIPLMDKKEYDNLISEHYVSRIAFQGEYPYIAPFLYVFDGKFLYFLSTKYGKKIEMFRNNPHVAVEIEKYSSDLVDYKFVTLQGKIEQVKDSSAKMIVRKLFVDMIKEKNLSSNIMAALGHSPQDPPESLLDGEKSYVWKLRDVENIIGIKNSE
ncbi:MAG: pyridoxamine 5'-phosphate oxidase family protein [Methanobacterium sp.]|nr:pyridoxamine 5'-phosphate oxidase family protein [Methanobacterium sp.]